MELFLRSQDNNMWSVIKVGESKIPPLEKPQARWLTAEAKAKLFIKCVLCRKEYDNIWNAKLHKKCRILFKLIMK
jgi:hypothetical protein